VLSVVIAAGRETRPQSPGERCPPCTLLGAGAHAGELGHPCERGKDTTCEWANDSLKCSDRSSVKGCGCKAAELLAYLHLRTALAMTTHTRHAQSTQCMLSPCFQLATQEPLDASGLGLWLAGSLGLPVTFGGDVAILTDLAIKQARAAREIDGHSGDGCDMSSVIVYFPRGRAYISCRLYC